MAKTSKKTTNPSTAPETLSKCSDWYGFMGSEAAMRFFPQKDEWRRRLMYSLLCWVDEKDEKGRPVLEIIQFCTTYKIPMRTLNTWVTKFSDLQEVYEDVKQILGSRRRIGAHHKDYAETVYKDMHRYDISWGPEVNEYWSKLKEKEAAAGGILTVEIPAQAPTGKIKPKKEKKDDQ